MPYYSAWIRSAGSREVDSRYVTRIVTNFRNRICRSAISGCRILRTLAGLAAATNSNEFISQVSIYHNLAVLFIIARWVGQVKGSTLG